MIGQDKAQGGGGLEEAKHHMIAAGRLLVGGELTIGRTPVVTAWSQFNGKRMRLTKFNPISWTVQSAPFRLVTADHLSVNRLNPPHNLKADVPNAAERVSRFTSLAGL